MGVIVAVADVSVTEMAFLLVHDGESRITRVREFEDITAGDAAYVEAERADDRASRRDVVLVFAPDLETVKVTHASYFRDQQVIVER